MLFGEDRQDHRQILFIVWEKHQAKQLLEPMEQKILHVIMNHPEYHHMFADAEKFLDKDFTLLWEKPIHFYT